MCGIFYAGIAIYLKPSMDFIPVFHQNDFSLECVTVGIEQNVEISYTWMKDGNPVLSRLVKDERYLLLFIPWL